MNDNVMTFLERNPDLFKEMGNIGMGHACTALSQVMRIKVDRSIPAVYSLTIDEITNFLGLFEGGSIGVFLDLCEDVGGGIVHIITLPFAAKLIKTFFNKDITCIADINPMEMSVIQEMTNITTAAFVNSLSSMTGLFIDISTPDFCPDLKTRVINKCDRADNVFMVENQFLVDMGSFRSELLFMPHRESLKLIAQKLCDRYGIVIPDNV